MKKTICLLGLCFFLCTGTSHSKEINITTDSNKWYPYSYEENGIARGLHIDIAVQALKNLGYRPSLTPLPWKRCLMMAKRGRYDAIISASYQPKRTEYLLYPPGASATNVMSEYRITQVTYCIVTNSRDAFEYTGDPRKLPYPVMAPFGYSVVDDLKKMGVFVLETSGDLPSFQILSSRNGCIITLPEIAELVMAIPANMGKYHISNEPFKSKSYFMVFSKKSGISDVEQKNIWDEIIRIREDKKMMGYFLKKY